MNKEEKTYVFHIATSMNDVERLEVKENDLTPNQKDLLFGELIKTWDNTPVEIQRLFKKRILSELKLKRIEHRDRQIDKFDLQGVFIRTYKSIAEVSRDTNISTASICQCCRGNQKKAGGFIWRYNNESLNLNPDPLGSIKHFGASIENINEYFTTHE